MEENKQSNGGGTKEFFKEDQAENLLKMIKCPNMDIVNFALDLILESEWFLPFKYNAVGEKKLADALKSIPTNGKRMWSNNWSGGSYKGRPLELQKKINKVRAKQTF